MKLFNKALIFLLVITILFSSIVFICLNIESKNKHVLSLAINGDNISESIRGWEGNDGVLYYFLPSFVNMADVTITPINTTGKLYIEETIINKGTRLDAFDANTLYTLTVKSFFQSYSFPIKFLHSANVATMFVDTQSGSMKKIHSDKNYKEGIGITLVNKTGTCEYSSLLSDGDLLKGRGQGSWGYSKKSYSIILSEESGLLGMNPSYKWTLLSNSTDETNLRNKLILDCAYNSDIGWAPQSEYVDLYLNGEYIGLYLLVEKIDVTEDKLNLLGENDFLCEIYEDIYGGNHFFTEAGVRIQIDSPNDIDKSNIERIQKLTQELEDALLSEDGINPYTNKSWTEYIDVDSWVKKLIIDEVFENADAIFRSAYFYYKEVDEQGVFYSGPVWDCDMSIGRVLYRCGNPNTFVIVQPWIKPDLRTPYYSSLYQKDEFYSRLTELYQQQFANMIDEIIDVKIDETATLIKDASFNNNLRWRELLNQINSDCHTSVLTSDDLKTYLKQRIAFLNKAWIEGVDYCLVQIERPTGGMYMSFCVEHGQCFDGFSDIDIPGAEGKIWINKYTKEKFDPNKPIEDDLELVLDDTSRESDKKPGLIRILLNNKNMILGVTGLCLFTLVIVLYVVHTVLNNKKR